MEAPDEVTTTTTDGSSDTPDNKVNLVGVEVGTLFFFNGRNIFCSYIKLQFKVSSYYLNARLFSEEQLALIL